MGIDADDLVALAHVDDDGGIGIEVRFVVGAEGGDDDLVALADEQRGAPFTCTAPCPRRPRSRR